MRKTLALALLASAVVAGCDNNPDAPFPPPGGTTPPTALQSALEFARSLIATQTCETSSPTEINGRELRDDETAITDLGAVNVACSG